MIRSYLKTFQQLNDPKILKALLFATLLTIGAIILALVFGATILDAIMNHFSDTLESWLGKGETWFYGIAQFLGGSLILVLCYFLFAGIHGAFVGIFIDDILDSIQQRHFPETPWNKAPSLMTSCFFSMRILLLTLGLNIIASPLLVLGWFIPPLGLSLQVILNGYILGKEYGQIVEFRIPNDSSSSQTPKYFLNGILASLLWIVPILNFLAPILLAGSVLHTRMEHKTD